MTTPSTPPEGTRIAEPLTDAATSPSHAEAPASMYDDIRAEFPSGNVTRLSKRLGGWLWRVNSDRPVRV